MFVNVVHSILIELAFAVELEFVTSASRLELMSKRYLFTSINFFILSGFKVYRSCLVILVNKSIL